MEFEHNPGKKQVSLLSATLLTTTCIFGSGWLFSVQLAAKYAGNWAFVAWVLAALLILCVGLCLAKVVAIHPVRGATTKMSALSHNNVFGMPFAFANWFGILMAVATEAQATTQYLSSAVGSSLLIHDHTLTFWGKVLAVTILAIYLAINFYGIRLLVKINNTITVFKIFVPLFTITVLLILAFQQTGNTAANFTLSTNDIFGPHDIMSAILAAGLIYAFNGFQIGAAFATEIKDPKRNVPLAITLSLVIATSIYLILQYAYMATLPNEFLQQNGGWQGLHFSSPLLDLSMLLGLNFLAMVLVADSFISPSAVGYTFLGASSRMLYAMASVGQMPRWLAVIDPNYNFSRRSMLTNWCLAAFILVKADSWSDLMMLVSGYHIIGYMAAPISMGALAPKTRWFGAIVFVVISDLMTTLPSESLLLVVSTLSVLILIYASLQYKVGVAKLIIFTAPFLIYLWLLDEIPDVSVVSVMALVFYLVISSKTYTQLCNKHRELAVS